MLNARIRSSPKVHGTHSGGVTSCKADNICVGETINNSIYSTTINTIVVCAGWFMGRNATRLLLSGTRSPVTQARRRRWTVSLFPVLSKHGLLFSVRPLV